MISSLNKALFTGFCLAAFHVQAQPAAPHDTLQLPIAQQPAAATPQAAEAEKPISSAATPPSSIDVSAVSAPSIAELGLPEDPGNAMPPAIWKDTTYDKAAPLLNWIRSGIAHPALRNLTLKLLTSHTTPPAGAPDSWLIVRAHALVALGAEDMAEALLASVPSSFANDQVNQFHAELLLLKADTAGACKLQPSTSEAGFWQKMIVLCKAVEGKKEEAQLALDVLSENNAGDISLLQEAVRHILDKSIPIKTLPTRWTMLDFALMRLAGAIPLLKDKLDSLPPVALKYIASDTSLEAKLRDKAESKAILAGMLPAKDAAKPPQQPFATALASDVTTLVTAFANGTPGDAEATVIERLAVDDSAAIQDTRRVQRLLTLMEPFGYRVSPDTWGKLLDRKPRFDGDVPAAMLVDRLNTAAQTGRKGEVVLLSALILNAADVEKTHESVLLPVVRALMAAGFTREAHSIAYDAVQSYRAH